MSSLFSRAFLSASLLFTAPVVRAQTLADNNGLLARQDLDTAAPVVRVEEPEMNRYYESVALDDSMARLFYYNATDQQMLFAVDFPRDSNGVQTQYTPDGDVFEVDTLVDGKKNGIVRYYEKGALQSTETWKNGVQQGLTVDYSEKGEIARVTFIDGEKFKAGAINMADVKKTRQLNRKLRRMQFADNLKHAFDGRTTKRKTYDQLLKLQKFIAE